MRRAWQGASGTAGGNSAQCSGSQRNDAHTPGNRYAQCLTSLLLGDVEWRRQFRRTNWELGMPVTVARSKTARPFQGRTAGLDPGPGVTVMGLIDSTVTIPDL